MPDQPVMQITVYEFWDVLTARGQLTHAWWYDTAVMPVMVMTSFFYLLMWGALWQEKKIPVMYLWMVIAGIPLVLIIPSFYIHYAPFDALAYAGFTPPTTIQQFDLNTARMVGSVLNQIAQIGLMGTALDLVVLVAILIVGRRSAPEPVKKFTQTVSQAFTRTFGRRGQSSERAIASPHGYVEVLNGHHKGTQFGVNPRAILGKSADVAIVITDAVVSRRHARFDVREGQVFLCETDKPSTNGTFVQKKDTQDFKNVDAAGIALASGDTISLGDSDDHNSVRLVYHKAPTQGGA